MNRQFSDMEHVSRVLDISMKAGRIMLENGAEISRVEDIMYRTADAFGVRHDSFFVLSNGIFTTGWDEANSMPGSFAKVAHIPLKGTRFDRVIAVNDLCGRIEKESLSLDDVDKALEQIRVSSGKSALTQLAAAFAGSGCFSILFGGTVSDAVVSAIAGMLTWMFVLFVSGPHLKKMTGNIFASAVATSVCLILSLVGMGDNLGQMIIGAVIPLIPGVALISGVCDIAYADYISGAVRLLDALFGFLCISTGVGAVLMTGHLLIGGLL